MVDSDRVRVREVIGPWLELMNAPVRAIESAMLRSSSVANGLRVHNPSGRPTRSTTATVRLGESTHSAARRIMMPTSCAVRGTSLA